MITIFDSLLVLLHKELSVNLVKYTIKRASLEYFFLKIVLILKYASMPKSGFYQYLQYMTGNLF